MKTERVVLITGAAGGIGALLVSRFLENGDSVVATDISGEALGQLAADQPDAARLTAVAGDIASEDDCARIAEAAGGAVHVLINCAGYFPRKLFEEIEPDDWRRIIDINLTGVFLMTRAVLPLMKERGWGRIVNFGSGTFFKGSPGQSHYISAKAGVIGLTRCMATEFGGYGITVNVITPGLTLTDAVLRTMPAEVIARMAADRPIARDMMAEDLVGPTFFLASPDADFITGQIINVDGGSSKH